jgi:chorismate mutase
MSGTLLQLIGLRGATTCPENSSDAIQKAVADLIDALVDPTTSARTGLCR